MGMDVYGRKPDETGLGEYFRNNVWWWYPLSSYIITTHEELAFPRTKKHPDGREVLWGSNDGDGLNAAQSRKLAEALQHDIDTGFARGFYEARQKDIDALPREICQLCNGTGVRTDGIGIQNGMDGRVVNADDDGVDNPRLGQVGWCNGCHGWGSRKDWKAEYPWSIENLQEFTTFILHSGGFRIC